ncbi:PspC domain-containing protein [Actinoplanes sp. TFC3]|uniref:PspC domain-containing protein n=1 Tax=Actinoplanes sp. TFC3 TaxID=1710355 RepID=UPI00082D3985|nr:PspC domain-containing protein [Actinoplanes sp. TFC3]
MSTPAVAPYKQLRRPLDDRIVAGVCSGLGRYFSVDPVLIRVAFAVLVVGTWGVAALAYPIIWFLIPEESPPAPASYVAPEDPSWGNLS